MAEKPSDPLGVWRDLLSQWETSANAIANKAMATDQFSGSMNQVMNVTLQAQQQLGEIMARYLATLNLPSRTDLASLGEQLAAIEARLGQIAGILERQAAAQGTTRRRPGARTPQAAKAPAPIPMPPRTKRPPPEGP
jgi:polyhydroxyalkanoic acid synthase PhaR subunit